MSVRLKRAARLVALAETAANVARGRLADAHRAVAASLAARDRAERAWGTAVEGFKVGVWAAGDLEQAAAHLRTLRRVADVRAADLARTEQEQRRVAQALFEAITEHRKLELWQQRLAAAEAEESGRAERRLADEQTARAAGRHS